MTPEQIVEQTAEVLVANTVDGFIGWVAPELGFHENDQRHLVVTEYADEGNIVKTYRVNITLEEIA